MRSKGVELLEASGLVGVPEIKKRMEVLEDSWKQIIDLTGDR